MIFLKIIIKITGQRFVKKLFFKKLIKGLFFNTLISLTLEGLIEFIVYFILNIYTKDLRLNGEILGFFIGNFFVFCAIIFIPLALIWAILTKDEI